jgi:hypothetical protein
VHAAHSDIHSRRRRCRGEACSVPKGEQAGAHSRRCMRQPSQVGRVRAGTQETAVVRSSGHGRGVRRLRAARAAAPQGPPLHARAPRTRAVRRRVAAAAYAPRQNAHTKSTRSANRTNTRSRDDARRASPHVGPRSERGPPPARAGADERRGKGRREVILVVAHRAPPTHHRTIQPQRSCAVVYVCGDEDFWRTRRVRPVSLQPMRSCARARSAAGAWE